MGPMGNLAHDFEFSDWHPERPNAARSFSISLTVHVVLATIAWIVNPTPIAREFPEPQLADLLDSNDRRIVWYTPQQELPAVAPAEQSAPRQDQPEHARYELPQRITASDPDPQSLQQMVRTDRPDIELTQDVDLPNIVSWKAPEVQQPRFQPTEPQLIAPSTEGLPALEAPQIDVSAPTDLSIVRQEELARLRLQQERAERRAPDEVALQADGLALDLQSQSTSLDASQFQELARLRYQAEQSTRANPDPQALTIDAAPDIRAQGTAATNVVELQQLSRLRYQTGGNDAPTAAPERRALDDGGAPVLTDPAVAPGVALDASQFQELARLRYQSGEGGARRDAPQRRALTDTVGGQHGQLEQLARTSGGSALDPAAYEELSRLRYQDSGGASTSRGGAPAATALGEVDGGAAPSIAASFAGSGTPAAGLPELDRPGAPPASLGTAGGTQSGGTGGDINLVAVGVNPADRLPEDLPIGSRRGSFTAGPNIGEGGGATGTGAPVTVPNLAIDGPRRGNSQPAGGGSGSDLLASLTRRPSIRNAQFPPPAVDVVFKEKPIDLDDPFVGRPVYTMAVNMPNITSYRGDWVLQFAEAIEATEDEPGETDEEIEQRLAVTDDALRPPFPLVKVDPRYLASAMRENVQGIVVFYAIIRDDGVMTQLRLVRGVDERLDMAARVALLKWEFEPARKNGEPVAVESIIRIPFRLDPNIKMRY